MAQICTKYATSPIVCETLQSGNKTFTVLGAPKRYYSRRNALFAATPKFQFLCILLQGSHVCNDLFQNGLGTRQKHPLFGASLNILSVGMPSIRSEW